MMRGKKSCVGRSEIKLTSVPETDLELELGWFGFDGAQKRKPRVAIPAEGGKAQLKSIQKTVNDIKQHYDSKASWQRQTQARFSLMAVTSIALILAFVVTAIARENEPTDWVFLAYGVVSLAFMLSGTLRNNRRLWMGIDILVTVSSVCNLVASLIFTHLHSSANLLEEAGLAKEESPSRMLRVLRVPLLVLILTQVFALSGLPSRFVIANGTIQLIFSCAENFVFLLFLFPDNPMEVISVTIFVVFGGTVTLFTVNDHEQQKQQAYTQRVLAEQSNLGKLCEQEAATTHKRRIVDYVNEAISGPVNEIFAKTNEAQHQSEVDLGSLLSYINLRSRFALEVLRDTVSLTKLETGGFEFRHKSFSLVDMTQAAIDVALKEVPQDVRQTINVQPDIADELKTISVRGDVSQLTFVLATLFTVAYRLSSTSSLARFKLSATKWQMQPPAVAVKIEIEFTERSPVDLSSLMRPWYGAKAHNYGLKLALCKSIVEKGHQGSLVGDSREGRGLFVLEMNLPLCASGTPASTALASA